MDVSRPPAARAAATIAAAIAAAGSAALLAGALAFQYLGGLPPCALCHWQRWAHLAVIGLAVAALLPAGRWQRLGLGRGLLALAWLALAAGIAIAFYHAGVEQKWWLGPSGCTGSGAGAGSIEDLRQMLLAAPVVRCDDIPWSLAGLSMAAWNGVISAALLAGSLLAARRQA
ncbi:MAG: hypothetical protein OHK0024_12430 [Thalassobaculales bacterium]